MLKRGEKAVMALYLRLNKEVNVYRHKLLVGDYVDMPQYQAVKESVEV